MKQNPTNLVQFLMAVQSVQHPKLRAEHCHFLAVLAPYADYKTGRNAHPGFERLSKAMRKSVESIRRYARHCEALGLIEVTRKPIGQNIATVWRFCLDNDAYQDSALGPQVDVEEGNTLAPQPEGVSPSSTRSLPHSSGSLGPQVCEGPPTTPPNKPPTTPPGNLAANPAAGVGGRGDVGKPSAMLDAKATLAQISTLFMETEDRPLEYGREKPELLRLIKLHGHDAMIAAFEQCRNRGNAWNSQTRVPLRKFVENIDGYLAAARKSSKHKPITEDNAKLAGRLSNIGRSVFFSTGLTDDQIQFLKSINWSSSEEDLLLAEQIIRDESNKEHGPGPEEF